MASASQQPQATLHLQLDASTFKALLRDLLFREAGKPYFKRLQIPRERWRRVWGDWQPLTTYQAEQALLPIGGSNIDAAIRRFFITHDRLQAEFHQGGMPVTAIHVLRQRCPQLNPALQHVHRLECMAEGQINYAIALVGGPAPERQLIDRAAEKGKDHGPFLDEA